MIHLPAECRGFAAPELPAAALRTLTELAGKCRGDILKMTTLAGSGHPGGSMSSIDLALTLYSLAETNPQDPSFPDRDRIVFSHGHISPGVYAALGNLGFFAVDEAIAHFRQAGSPFEGHVEHGVPGVEWSSGNLGQGLSAGCGMAAAMKVLGSPSRVFVLMGDGEQQKGQISEARRFAVKYRLANLTAVIDRNHLQISGDTATVMPQNIGENFHSDGWRVLEIDGHDFRQIYSAYREAIRDPEHCVVILARTVMGKGVSFMENDEKWHGQTLDDAQLGRALSELGLPNDLERYRELRRLGTDHLAVRPRPRPVITLDPGSPRLYPPDKPTDNRSAWGKALEDMADANRSNPAATPVAVFDCDLSTSVKTAGFAARQPERFFQSGIMEHHAAVASGAMSTQGIQVFWSDFGVFGVDEVYNQHRINDINEANLKVVCTHLGTDVGEDGKTHQCIDYLGLLRNLFHFKTIIPADPNQTDRVTRWVASQPGNFFVGMGRSKTPAITRPDGTPFFGLDYRFTYGRADILREGEHAAVATMGIMAHRAVQAADELSAEGIRLAVLNITCSRDLDSEALAYACRTGILITYEDHNTHSGLAGAIANWLATEGRRVCLVRLGVTEYATSGTPGDIARRLGLDVESLKERVRRLVEERRTLDNEE